MMVPRSSALSESSIKAIGTLIIAIKYDEGTIVVCCPRRRCSYHNAWRTGDLGFVPCLFQGLRQMRSRLSHVLCEITESYGRRDDERCFHCGAVIGALVSATVPIAGAECIP